MKQATTNKRIAELSATLKPITSFGIDMLTGEMCGEAEDYCSYNGSYYYNGVWLKPIFDGSFLGSILQKVDKYQVIRQFLVNAYMEGLAYDEIPEDWDDEDAPDFPELEYKGCEEVKQIWFDKQGNEEIIRFRDEEYYRYCDESYIVHIDSMQDYCTEPTSVSIILDAVREHTDYCYDYFDRISLEWRLSVCREYLSIAEPDFLKLVEDNQYDDRCKDYKHVFKIAHRRGWQFPTDRETARLWLEHISLLDKNGQDTHNPLLICPDMARLAEEHQRLVEEHNARLAEQRRIENARLAEERKELRKKQEAEFSEKHAYLFGFDFTDNNFHYVSLDSVEAYETEGIIMHHCIYNCGHYHTNHDKLSMHITDLEGNRVATCTIIMSKGEIECIQPIGNDTGYYHEHHERWQDTEDYKGIWNTLCARMHILQKQARENKKRLSKQKDNKQQLKIAI